MITYTGGVTAPQFRVLYDSVGDGYIYQNMPTSPIVHQLKDGVIRYQIATLQHYFLPIEPAFSFNYVRQNEPYKSFGNNIDYYETLYNYSSVVSSDPLLSITKTVYQWIVPRSLITDRVKLCLLEKHYDYSTTTQQPVIPNGYNTNPYTIVNGGDARVKFYGFTSKPVVRYDELGNILPYTEPATISKPSRRTFTNSVPSLSWGYVEKSLYETHLETLIKDWHSSINWILIEVVNDDYYYAGNYGVARDLVNAWLCFTPEWVEDHTLAIPTGFMADVSYAAVDLNQDITRYVTSMNWNVGVQNKLQFDAVEADAVINLHNVNGELTSNPIPVNRSIIIQAKNGNKWQTMYTGQIDEFVPIVGNPAERRAELRCSTGIFANTTEANLGELEPLNAVDMNATSEQISTDGKTSYQALTYSLSDVLTRYLPNSSWRAANTLSGFRLNEGRLGETTTLLDTSFYIDTLELNENTSFVGWLSIYKDMTLRTLINTIAYTSWAYPLINRTGQLIFRKNYGVSDLGDLPVYGDKTFTEMRYSTGENVYNIVQVGYYPTELACADIAVKDGINQSVYKGVGNTLVELDIKNLLIWYPKPFRDEHGSIQTGKEELRPRSDTRFEVVPYTGQPILMIHRSDTTSSNPYSRNSSVVYTSTDNITWSKTMVVFNRKRRTYKLVASWAWNDDKELALTLPQYDYIDIRRLTAQVLLEREKATAEVATDAIYNKTYKVDSTFITNQDAAENLANTILYDLTARPEYTEVGFYVHDQNTLNLVFNEGVGNRIRLKSQYTDLPSSNVHLIIGESHSVRSSTEWRVNYFVRRVEDVVD